MTSMIDYMPCPFCGEDDFDLIGLKHHLLSGHCEEFNEVEPIKRPQRRSEGKSGSDAK